MKYEIASGKYAFMFHFIAICCAILLLTACDNNTSPAVTNTPHPTSAPPATLTPEIASFASPDPNMNDGIVIENAVATTELDANSCAVGSDTRFPEDSSVIYFAAEATVPRDTEVFVRLFRNSSPIQDTEIIIADQDYTDICIFFEFTHDREEGFFRRGEYTAQMIANDVLRARINFFVE